MLKKIGIGFAVLGAILAIFAIVVATRPGEFRYERSLAMSAPVDAVFPLVNDFHNWKDWSPWDKLDPSQKTTYDGPASGVGAKYGWNGNDDVGEGRMSITDAKANENVKIKLEFIRPFAAVNDTEFLFKPEGSGTKVSWVMSGTNNFMSKAFGMFVDMDKMLGSDFDKGLTQMKVLAEKEAARRAEEAKKAAPAAPAPVVPAATGAPAAAPTSTAAAQ